MRSRVFPLLVWFFDFFSLFFLAYKTRCPCLVSEAALGCSRGLSSWKWADDNDAFKITKMAPRENFWWFLFSFFYALRYKLEKNGRIFLCVTRKVQGTWMKTKNIFCQLIKCLRSPRKWQLFPLTALAVWGKSGKWKFPLELFSFSHFILFFFWEALFHTRSICTALS